MLLAGFDYLQKWHIYRCHFSMTIELCLHYQKYVHKNQE